MKYLFIVFIVLVIVSYIVIAVDVFKKAKKSDDQLPIWLLLLLIFPIVGPLFYLAKHRAGIVEKHK